MQYGKNQLRNHHATQQWALTQKVNDTSNVGALLAEKDPFTFEDAFKLYRIMAPRGLVLEAHQLLALHKQTDGRGKLFRVAMSGALDSIIKVMVDRSEMGLLFEMFSTDLRDVVDVSLSQPVRDPVAPVEIQDQHTWYGSSSRYPKYTITHDSTAAGGKWVQGSTAAGKYDRAASKISYNPHFSWTTPSKFEF